MHFQNCLKTTLFISLMLSTMIPTSVGITPWPYQLNSTDIFGNWWVQMIVTNGTIDCSCYEFINTAYGSGLKIDRVSLASGKYSFNPEYFTVNSFWTEFTDASNSGYDKIIISYDMLNNQWMMIADTNSAYFYLLTLNQTPASSLLTQSLLALLKTEGINLASYKVYYFNSTECEPAPFIEYI